MTLWLRRDVQVNAAPTTDRFVYILETALFKNRSHIPYSVAKRNPQLCQLGAQAILVTWWMFDYFLPFHPLTRPGPQREISFVSCWGLLLGKQRAIGIRDRFGLAVIPTDS